MFSLIHRTFDAIVSFWEEPRTVAVRSAILVTTLLVSVGLIELRRQGLLDSVLPGVELPTNHFVAISWTISVLLLFEIVMLVLTLARSVAKSLGGQLEVYALILLLDAFLPLSEFGEPIELDGHWHPVLAMLSDAGGAVLLFFLASIYTRLQRHASITQDETGRDRFVAIKKLIGLGLLGFLVLLVGSSVLNAGRGEPGPRVFDWFFTAFVFVDVLLAMVSTAFTRSHPIVFRNFGFAFVAVMLRLSLAAPEFYRPALGVGAGLFAVGLTLTYNYTLGPVPLRSAVASDAAGEEGEEPRPG